MNRKISDKQILDIFCEFDFEAVHKVMKRTDWTWATIDRVPTAGELREHALNLFDRLNKDDEIDSTSSGGLEVYRSDDGCAGLRFIFEECVAYHKEQENETL